MSYPSAQWPVRTQSLSKIKVIGYILRGDKTLQISSGTQPATRDLPENNLRSGESLPFIGTKRLGRRSLEAFRVGSPDLA